MANPCRRGPCNQHSTRAVVDVAKPITIFAGSITTVAATVTSGERATRTPCPPNRSIDGRAAWVVRNPTTSRAAPSCRSGLVRWRTRSHSSAASKVTVARPAASVVALASSTSANVTSG